MRTRVKICGITRPEDGRAAAKAGADAIGLVFYPDSPRYVPVQTARAICRALPPFVTVVGLFVDATADQIDAVLGAVPLDLLQFHGSEVPQACERYDRPYIKAIAMQPGVNPRTVMEAHRHASGFLLDAYQPLTHGGGGIAFDWDAVPGEQHVPIVLAGGLNAENVAQAIRQVRPFAVDVSSGVEVAKGVKSAEKIEAFMRGVERGDASQSG